MKVRRDTRVVFVGAGIWNNVFLALLVNRQGAENGDLVALEKQGTAFFCILERRMYKLGIAWRYFQWTTEIFLITTFLLKLSTRLTHRLYLSPLPPSAVVYFFRAGTLFCTENAKCWPMLANFDYFVSNVRTFWCTFAELNNAVVPQNWQISGSRLITFVAIAISKTSSSNSSCLAKTW